MKKFIKIISLLVVVSMMSLTLMLSLVGCNNNNNKQTDEGNNVDSIVDDLPLDADGKFDVTLLENVQLNMWSVIGQPDQEILLNLIKEFNKEYFKEIKPEANIIVAPILHIACRQSAIEIYRPGKKKKEVFSEFLNKLANNSH